MRKNYLKNRAGVSLITVLMFMLVATIAATATWKFISSEGFSSASRMLKREAYQSAQAGIENARSWMTFHANDVGALIKQFQDHGKPINIDNQLRALQKAGQNYHVWVTGVNTTSTTYKIKVLSAGEARNDTRHTEVAIFNVDGLYRVKLPVTQSSSNFSEAFHGELKSIDKLNIDKAVITQTPDVKNAGGQALNDLTVTEYLILDGSFYANNTNNIKELYVTGDVGTCSGINVTNNMYVHGNFYPGNVKSTISGTLYADGNVNLRDFYPYTALTGGCYNDKPGDLEVGGNITADTLIYYDHGGAHTFTAKSSAVFNSIRFPSSFYDATVIDKVRIEHNLYVKGNSPGQMGSAKPCSGHPYYNGTRIDGRDAMPRTKVGSGDADKIWLYGFYTYLSGPTPGDFSVCPETTPASKTINKNCQTADGFTCARSMNATKWFGYKGQFLETEPSDEEIASWKANKLDKYKDKLEERDESCDRIKTPIQVNKKIFELGLNHSKTTPFDCNTNIWSEWDITTEMLNSCYQTAKSNGKLYNNDWLILEFGTPMGWQKDKMKGTLNGNFIFKFNADATNHQVNLPATTGNSKVLLYLPNGWPSASNYNIEFAENSGDHRYFIFSEGDVVRFDMNTLENPMSGSVVMGKNQTTGKCASFNTEGNNTLFARFDQEMTEDLSDASIICDNDGSNICSGMSSVSSSSGGSSDDDGYDHYYISMAPQLGISLESQSKSYETVSNSEDLASSFIILPRVISMPNDPYGTLGDYLNVITLNKPQNSAPLAKTNLDLSHACTKVNSYNTLDIASLNSKLFSPEGSKLPKGTYRCDITADGYDETVPVWVSIDNKELRNLHQISFTEASQEIGSTATKDIYIRLQPKIPPINLNVSCPTPPDHWSYKTVRDEVTTGETCTFNVSNNYNTERLLKLFTIETEGASSGTMSFQILEGEDYIATSPATTGIYMSSTGTLNRAPATFDQLDEYCQTHADECPTEEERYNWKDCAIEAGEKWVEPDGTGFQTVELNESWLISAALNTTVQFNDVSKEEMGCIVIIPEEENTCTFTDNQKNCVLNASAKEKVHKIKFKFKNVESGKNPSFTVERDASTPKVCRYNETNEEHECIVNVYKGGQVSMHLDTDNDDNKDFTYWQCEGPSCPNHDKWSSNSYSPFTLSDNETVIIVKFNEVDKHCFFDKFESEVAACNEFPSTALKEYCIDYCAPADHCESASATISSFPDAKWHLVRGKMSMIDYENGIISVDRTGDITLMSTINADAGTHGTLKALLRLPKDNSSSGFLLGSNAEATSYLMLNVFINNDGYATVRVCNAEGTTCREEALELSVTENDMVMIEAEITATEITVIASKGNESTKASVKFQLGTWSGYFEGSHVGFRIASPKFKIYGIGWKSTNYECFDTYPTIKCSFAAVAYYGVIPTTRPVKPWVGYSGWEGWNTSDCTEKYYYRGDDACHGDNYGYVTCEDEGYVFDSTSSGKHGYTDLNGTDIKTAKVGLDCQSSITTSNSEEMMWANDSAHCGVFWTGPQDVCSTTEKITNEISLYGSSDHQSAAFTRAINMRSAQLKIDAENSEHNEIWVWLYSQGPDDELYPSAHVSMNEASRIFNASDFETETGGFDISKVKSVYFENKGNGSVTIKNISVICETAVRVNSCQAEDKLKGSSIWIWGQTYQYVQITASINNRDGVDEFQIVAQKAPNTTKTYEISRGDILVYGTDKAIFTLPRGINDINGGLHEWTFSIKVKSDGSDYSEPKACRTISGFAPSCKIDQPGPGESPEIAQNEVHFKASLTNCIGCSYIVTLDGDEKLTGNCTKTTGNGLIVGSGQLNKCDVKIPKEKLESFTVGTTHTFRFYSPDGDFDECEKTFTVKEANTAPEPGNVNITECKVTNVEGSTVTLETKSTGCGPAETCTYNITPAADGSGDYNDNGTVYFSYDGDTGTISHKLTVTKGTKTDDCTFEVTYSSSSSSEEESSSSSEEESSSSSAPSSSSKTDEFDCTDANSTTFARESESETEGGQCVKYTMPYAEVLRVGCWWAPALPVNITLKNCNGSLTTISHKCGQGNDGWVGVSTGKCTIYLKPDKKIKWKFSDWN